MLYPVFGIRGASWFFGVPEWLYGLLLFIGYWDKRVDILRAIGSVVTYFVAVTIIPFMPNGWAASAAGFPAMVGKVPFLMKDIVLLAASIPVEAGCRDRVQVRAQWMSTAQRDTLQQERARNL